MRRSFKVEKPVPSRRWPVGRRKYASTDGCYVDEPFNVFYVRKHLGGRVKLRHYKGAMLLGVARENDAMFSAIPAAWLRGDDLDALIKMLREAKRVWLRAHRKTKLWLKRERRESRRR